MNDSQNPYGPSDGGQPPTNPYGAPAPESPYGTPPPAGQPFGQQPYGSPYGGQPGGQYGGPPAFGATDPNKRPGTVTAASIITLIFSGLSLVLFLFGTVAALVAREDMVRELNRELRNESAFDGITGDDVAVFIVAAFAIMAVWCLLTMVFAVLAMRRKNWARVLVVISSVVTALFSLLAILSGISMVTLAASIAVIVLYFVGGANQWYAKRPAALTY